MCKNKPPVIEKNLLTPTSLPPRAKSLPPLCQASYSGQRRAISSPGSAWGSCTAPTWHSHIWAPGPRHTQLSTTSTDVSLTTGQLNLSLEGKGGLGQELLLLYILFIIQYLLTATLANIPCCSDVIKLGRGERWEGQNHKQIYLHLWSFSKLVSKVKSY